MPRVPHATHTHTTQHTHVINRITNQYKCHSSAPWHLRFVASWAHITHTHSSAPPLLPACSAVCRPLSINWRVNWLNLPQSKRQQQQKTKTKCNANFPNVFSRLLFLLCLVLSLYQATLFDCAIVSRFSLCSLIRQAPFLPLASGQWAWPLLINVACCLFLLQE